MISVEVSAPGSETATKRESCSRSHASNVPSVIRSPNAFRIAAYVELSALTVLSWKLLADSGVGPDVSFVVVVVVVVVGWTESPMDRPSKTLSPLMERFSSNW